MKPESVPAAPVAGVPPLPARLQNRFSRLLRRTQAVYGLVSRQPAILHAQVYTDTVGELMDSYERVFEATRGRPLYLLCSHGGLDEQLLPGWLALAPALKCRFPDVHCIHLCNQAEAVEPWQAQGLQAIHCNHNAFVDEAVFRPLDPPCERTFRAVYDARLIALKRHYLASQVDQLALIYYVVPVVDDLNYAEQLKSQFAEAHCFNHSEEGYQRLDASAVNRCLNRCGVGLCLSEAEGAMYASVQYLLSGLGVITTPSRGGRDDFFDPRFCLTVDADPQAVSQGVSQLLARKLDPWQVHQATLERIWQHRQRFIQLVQSLYDRHGVSKQFSEEWPGLFFNRFLGNQSHHKAIEWLS